jgi:hypothetical protein
MSDLTMTRGDTGSFMGVAVTVTTISEPLDLTGCEIIFTAKDSIDDTDENAVINCDTDVEAGITVTDAEQGIFVVVIAPSKTDSIEIAGSSRQLIYDVQIQDADDNVFTVDTGTLTIFKDVTRRTI